MLKKLIKKTTKKIIKKALDKLEKSNKIEPRETHNAPTVAGFKWTKERQKMVMKLMDKVPPEKRIYH